MKEDRMNLSERFEKHSIEQAEKLLAGTIVCIDSHTGGEPTRLVVGGLPPIHGDNIIEKSRYFAKNYDYIRTTLTAEPRAHKAMHALILCPPSSQKADFGLIITCALGYLNMCGHGLIGAVASVLETGIITPKEPETKVIVETPAGNMEVLAQISEGKVECVTFRNQPSFVYKQDLELDVNSFGHFTVDVAYGGNWYVVVNAADVGMELNIENLDGLGQASRLILEAVNARISADHPLLGPAGEIPQLVFMGPPKNPQANGLNLITSEALGFDRSPCGTGSSAKMAVLYARGELPLNQDYIHESATTGSLFRGRLVEKTKLGKIEAVVPEIAGSAYITAIKHIVIDPRDPLKYGFTIE
ncbi:proline racemase family protein [Thermoproteota archaeon]